MERSGNASDTKVEGGFVLISVEQLCAAWSAYASGRIRLFDLRVWFAAWEMTARRCMLSDKRVAKFSHEELHELVGGVGGRHVRASLRRLGQATLISWSDSGIQFPSIDSSDADTAAMLLQIVNRRRRVPVPRRILRFLAGGAGRVLIATVLAHLLRCMYLRNRMCQSTGTCKASWTAALFGVDPRNVKAARKQLMQLGWLIPSSAPQWRLNRYGATLSINLAWCSKPNRELNEVGPRAGHDSPPRQPSVVNGSPLPESNKQLLTEYKNQKPASGRPAGVWRGEAEDNTRPDWRRLVPRDLECPRRLGILYRDAVARNVFERSDRTRLAFVAAAEHARRKAQFNACGLFRALVTRGLWHFITQEAEDDARKRLKQIDEAREKRADSRTTQMTHRSDDDALRRVVQDVLSGLALSHHQCG